MDYNLYQNLAWYTEDGKFQGIVEELEQKAGELEVLPNSAQQGDDNSEYKQKHRAFRKAILFHAKKSGYSKKHPEVLDVDKFFFAGSKINHKALEGFEKDIVKDHMYQKHLWDFMRTTGHLSLVSKLTLASSGKNAEDITPISVKGNEFQASPISSILSEIPDSVPLYLYSDGSVSTLYDKNRAKLSFNTTVDKSGFDWKRTGWDPNYDIEHKDLRIVYNPKTGEYTAVKTSGGTLAEEVVQIFTPEKASPLSMKVILAEENQAILEDPFYIFIFKKLYDIIIKNKKLTQEEEDYRDELFALIDRGLEAVGADKITAIVRSSAKDKEADDKTIIKAYREVLGDRVASSLHLISADDAANAQAKSLDRVIARRDEEAGTSLASKLAYLVGLGLTGSVLSSAVKTSMMAQDASFLNLSDLKEVGFSDEEAKTITKLNIPQDKEQAFSKALFNIMDDYSLISLSGVSEKQVADLVYESVVLGIKHNEFIELPVTLNRICSTKSTIFDNEVKANVRKSFEDELATLPSEKRTKTLEEKVNNAVLRYKVIKEASGMSEAEVVSSLIKQVESVLAPLPTIRYMSSSDPSSQKLNVRLKFSDIIDNALNSEKQVTFTKPIDFTKMQTKSKSNLLDASELAKWLKTPLGKKSGLDTESLSELASKVRISIDLQGQPILPKVSSLQDQPLSVILKGVIAELSPVAQITESLNLGASDVNPVFYGLPLLSKMDSSLSFSLLANSSMNENKGDVENFLSSLPLQYAYKTNGENQNNDKNYQQQSLNSKDNIDDLQSNSNNPNGVSTPIQQTEKKKKTKLNTGGIIGVTVAGAVVATGVGVGIYFLYKHHKNKEAEKLAKNVTKAEELLDHDSIMLKLTSALESYEKQVDEDCVDTAAYRQMCRDFNRLSRYTSKKIINQDESRELWDNFGRINEKRDEKKEAKSTADFWVKNSNQKQAPLVKGSALSLVNDLLQVHNQIKNKKVKKRVTFGIVEHVDIQKFNDPDAPEIDPFNPSFVWKNWDELSQHNVKKGLCNPDEVGKDLKDLGLPDPIRRRKRLSGKS